MEEICLFGEVEVSVYEPLENEVLQGVAFSPQRSPSLSTAEEGLYCFACKKKFANQLTFQTHENGVKHINNLRKISKLLSPLKNKSGKPSLLQEQEKERLLGEIRALEGIVRSKPNQAFKGIFLAAKSLIDKHFLQLGAKTLHKLLFYLEQSIPLKHDIQTCTLIDLLPIGRVVLYFKSAMIISRLLQVSGNAKTYQKSAQYAFRALSSFFGCNWEELDHVCDVLPFDMALKQCGQLYEAICSKIPHNFLSKREKVSKEPHDIYSLLYTTLMEIAGLYSLYKPEMRSLMFYTLASSLSRTENQKEDLVRGVEKVVLMRNYLSCSSKALFIFKKEKEFQSFTRYHYTIEILESMTGKAALEERFFLLEKTNNFQWLVEAFVVSIVKKDFVHFPMLAQKFKLSIHQCACSKLLATLEILSQFMRLLENENFIRLLDMQESAVWPIITSVPLLYDIYASLLLNIS